MTDRKSVDPVEDHLRHGNLKAGDEIITLAKDVGVPLGFRLLSFPPHIARAEAAVMIARAALQETDNG